MCCVVHVASLYYFTLIMSLILHLFLYKIKDEIDFLNSLRPSPPLTLYSNLSISLVSKNVGKFTSSFFF